MICHGCLRCKRGKEESFHVKAAQSMWAELMSRLHSETQPKFPKTLRHGQNGRGTEGNFRVKVIQSMWAESASARVGSNSRH